MHKNAAAARNNELGPGICPNLVPRLWYRYRGYTAGSTAAAARGGPRLTVPGKYHDKKKSTGTKVPVLKPVKTTVSGMKDTAERARRPRRRIWSIGHWRGHSRAHGPKPPTFVAHGVVVHGPDSDSNFARCVLRIRPSHWRPRTPRKALLSHISSTVGTAKLRAVALDRWFVSPNLKINHGTCHFDPPYKKYSA